MGVLLAASFAVIQVLIGGTRLLFSLPAYGLLAVMSLVALMAVKRRRPPPSEICLITTAIFFGYILGRALLSPVDYLARPDIYSVLGGLLVYFFVARVFTDSKPRIYMLFFLLALSLVHVFVGLEQFRRGDNFMPIRWLQRFDYGRRASGFYVCPNHLAGLLEVLGIFGLSIACWSRYPRWVKLLIGYAAAVCYFGVVLTGSRGGYLSTIASVTVFAGISLWLLRRSGSALFWRIGAVAGAGAIVVAIAIAFFLSRAQSLNERATNILDTQNMRVDLWQAAVQQWKLAPIFGTGSGTYLYYGRKFRTDRLQVDPVRAHNDYLDLLAEYGGAGALTFLVFLLVHLWNGWTNLLRVAPQFDPMRRWVLSNGLALQIGAIAAIAAYVVHSIFDFNLHIPANVLLMAFVFAILANPGTERQGAIVEPNRSILAWRLTPAVIAIIILVQCLRLLPGEWFTEQARVALRREHAGTTIRLVERALETERHNFNLYDYLGRAQIMRGDARTKPEDRAYYYRRALDAFKEGRKLAPLDEDFALQLGAVYDKLGRFKEAEWMYYQALQLDPKSIWAKYFYDKHLKLWRGGG